ncbi:MAG: ATP-dependent zinc metalloprotease FtsH [Oscillospiraceae bacterium]|jgi:cell division protease FtsH|nr:ATP-dependent zinc metalloprotease FtsH [Oscillospiraceae bacterium]
MKDILFYFVVLVILLGTVYLLTQLRKPKEPSYAEVLKEFHNENVKEFVLEGNTLTLYLYNPPPPRDTRVHRLYSVGFFYEDAREMIADQLERGVLVNYNYDLGFVLPGWLMAAPYFVLIVVIIGLWYFMLNRTGGGDARAMNFKRAHPRLHSEDKRKYTFADVEGAQEEKEELQEIVDFLKNPRKFNDIGARIPRGVLLVGPPGTGKTLLAKAVAGEAAVQFLSISGSDFVELYVGVGASRVRNLFEEAKKNAPCIVFIDEIDAVGRHRGAGMGGGHDEREQTLNQLLVEMDGFISNEGVIVIAATNRPDILDPALLRPGRFDRQVYLGYPDIKGREAILLLHGKNKPCDDTVDYSIIAKQTAGLTGADLENLLNESALLAARRGKQKIGMDEISESMLKIIAGPAKKSKVVSDKERRLSAYHEAGHAVVRRNLQNVDPVHHISIIPRGMAGGVTVFLPQEDKSFMSRNEMLENIVSALGGRVAEKLVLDDISTGASDDIKKVTRMARSMVTKYGMSDNIGPINYGGEHEEVFLGRDLTTARNFSEETGAMIDREIKSIVDKAYQRCETILRDCEGILHKVAEYLLDNETMDSATFELFFDTGRVPGESAPQEG